VSGTSIKYCLYLKDVKPGQVELYLHHDQEKPSVTYRTALVPGQSGL